jgi:2,5-diketo-D-gluconate reductase A
MPGPWPASMVRTMSKTFQLAESIALPAVGFGTYLIDAEDVEDVVGEALGAGYRHIDTAEAYGNEASVGRAIDSFLRGGSASREDLFVTTKLWPGNAAWEMPEKDYDATIDSLGQSLENLGLDQVDLYLIHAPFSKEGRLDQWRALVELRDRGMTRAIGVSNYDESHLEEIRGSGLPMPEADQIELHPWSQKTELIGYLAEHGIQPIAYSSLVPLSTWRSEEGQESAKTAEMAAEGEDADSPFKAMADKYRVSEARVLLRWAVQSGYAVLPKTSNRERMLQNLDLFSFEIDAADMAQIATMDRGGGIAWSTGDPTAAE